MVATAVVREACDIVIDNQPESTTQPDIYRKKICQTFYSLSYERGKDSVAGAGANNFGPALVTARPPGRAMGSTLPGIGNEDGC